MPMGMDAVFEEMEKSKRYFLVIGRGIYLYF